VEWCIGDEQFLSPHFTIAMRPVTKPPLVAIAVFTDGHRTVTSTAASNVGVARVCVH